MGLSKDKIKIEQLEEEVRELQMTLIQCMEAIRKNLFYAHYKDEEVLMKAYQKAKQTLGIDK